jgi:hypothetical protein
MQFNPNDHLIKIKSGQVSQDYLPVAWRLVWFREVYPQGTIDTEELEYDPDREVEAEVYVWNPEKRRSEKTIKKARGYARYRAVVTDGKGGRATATKSENAASFPEYGEKAETGSVGRALAMLGFGTQFTGDEFFEEHRIVDSPVDRGTAESASNGNANGQRSIAAMRPHSVNGNGAASAEETADAVATDQQLASIRKLCDYLGKAEPENPDALSFADAKALIAQLSQEYKQSRKAS